MPTQEPDRPTVQCRLDISAVNVLLYATRFTLEKWPGGHPLDQENLTHMRDMLFRMQLELQIDSQE
jgi:hypothetical protein